MTEGILGFLQNNVVKYKEKAELCKLSAVKIGGVADVIAYPDTLDKMLALVKFLEKNEIKHKILGRMSNVLPSDDQYNGIIVKTDLLRRINLSHETVVATAGVPIALLSRKCAYAGLSGIEPLTGIPGSIGGAIYGNAGAFGREIGELVESVTLYDTNLGRTLRLFAKDMGFGYRDSLLRHQSLIVLSASLKLVRKPSREILDDISHFSELRKKSQPIGLPSLGSVFKRPANGTAAWQLIDGCGLRGYRIGNAAFSEKHAGFIVNLGGATSADYMSLVEYAEELIRRKFHIELQREFELL